MNIKLINQNLFTGNEQALILTVDGAATGMEGNIARAFARLYPECWEELSLDIDYPIPLGQSRLYEIDEGVAEEENCPYRYVLVASTLHHLETLDNNQKNRIIQTALISALSLTMQKGIKQLATAILSGGWRLPEAEALQAMITTYEQLKQINPQIPMLNIYIAEQEKYRLTVEKYPQFSSF